MNGERQIAYFSMEMALELAMPTYCGGLGVLAGDMMRAAADGQLPVVGVSLLHRKGYFRQKLDRQGAQTEEPCEWTVEHFTKELEPRVAVTIENRTVHVRAWQYDVKGTKGEGFRSICWIPTCQKTRSGTATLPINYTAETSGIGCARKSCWESAACGCCGCSAIAGSRVFT